MGILEKSALKERAKASSERDQARAMIGQLEDRMAIAEKEVIDLQGIVDRLTTEVASLKAETSAKFAALDSKVTELAAVTVELGGKITKLDGANQELITLRDRKKADDQAPYSNPRFVGKFAFYIDYADALRAAKKSGVEVGPLVDMLKGYVFDNLAFGVSVADPRFETVHEIDLSWYPMTEQLVLPPEPTVEPDIGGDGGARDTGAVV
ncbi:hypothetical protein OROGR_025551 [Orobanche gracilis]